ncbi:MAG TPA: cyanophycin synthetase [Gemmatimonadales bacterium]|jgi:cyanophycin synthetase|nr:cyanophycin synthetase [Gemmatimonadales bacterium]
MRILDRAVYVGPSLYAHFPVIRLELDLGELEEWPSGKLGPAFTDALVAALPGLQEHGCSYGEPGGFIRRLTEGEGTWMGHILEHVAIELQNVAGEPVTFGKTRSQGAPGHYHVVYQYEQEDVGLEAGHLGITLLHSLLPPALRPEGSVPAGFDFPAERDEFIRFAQRRALGPSTMSLVRAAEERRIPWIRLNEQSLIQFGHGRFQQRIQATVTSRTPHIAVELASDKEETNRLLANLGLPVPRQRLVQRVNDAVSAAEQIGYPVVVKPYNANHGRGISIHLTTETQVRDAFELAREHSRSVIVESFITGEDHRMLVINGELVAVSKRVPGHVVGDGVHTVEELVEEVNRDPRRGIGHEKVLTRLVFDHQADTLLAGRGYTRETVPADGERVFLRSTGNLSTGGTATDLTDVVHPDNIGMAVRAVRAIGLDVGGVDFLTSDITESYKDVGGAICEVNAAPGFRMHMAPSEGRPRDVAGPVMDMLFPPGTPSRIPIAAVTGTNGKTTTARMLAHIQKLAGHHVGLTSTDGVYIDGQRTVAGDMTGPVATRMVLSDPGVDVAVLEIARGGLLRAGMGVRHCDVGAVLNVKSDHLGLRGVGTLAELAKVKRIVVEVARDTAILNADDPLCLAMADYTEAKHLCYVTMDPTHGLVGEHIKAGGRGVVRESGIKGEMITIYDRGAHIPLLWTHLIPATLEGRALHNVQNAMFAAAMAFSMGLKLEDIRHGLRTFDTTFFQAPGRMNIFDEHPFKVILDYGHNAAAVEVMCQLVSRLEVSGQRICVLAAPGDRRDEDIVEVGRIAAGHFDRYIVRRDDHLRGRGPEEVPHLLRDTLLQAGVAAERIAVIPDEQAAIDAALREAQPGDLVLIFADAVTRSWKQVIQFRPEAPNRPIDRTRAAVAEPVAVPAAPSPVPAPGEDGRREFVRDGRGVRLAREEQAD